MVSLLKKDNKKFCDEMDRMFQCRNSPENPDLDRCDIFCPFKIAGDVERWCNQEGMGIRKALERWAIKELPNSSSFLILADALGVPVSELKELIALMRKAHEKI